MNQRQATFEKVARHLFAQGKQSKEPGPDWTSVCLYRGPEETSCAVGCLIPDELYSPDMEYKSVTHIANGLKQLPEFSDMLLLNDLQEIHDWDENWKNSDTLQKALIKFGVEVNLSVSFIDGLYFGMSK